MYIHTCFSLLCHSLLNCDFLCLTSSLPTATWQKHLRVTFSTEARLFAWEQQPSKLGSPVSHCFPWRQEASHRNLALCWKHSLGFGARRLKTWPGDHAKANVYTPKPFAHKGFCCYHVLLLQEPKRGAVWKQDTCCPPPPTPRSTANKEWCFPNNSPGFLQQE